VTAPLIRGLKLRHHLDGTDSGTLSISDRPAHQGIETVDFTTNPFSLKSPSISDRPAHQGIETITNFAADSSNFHSFYQ